MSTSTGWGVSAGAAVGYSNNFFSMPPVWILCGTGVVTYFTPLGCTPVEESVVHSIQDHKTSKEKEYTNVYCRFSY